MGLLDDLSPNAYKYYDTPEGEDCFKKLWYVTKYAGVYSVLGASIDVLLYSHPKGYAATLGRYVYLISPALGVAAAFATTVCTATNVRHKDDKWNYLLGGLASGAVVGAWRKNIKVGVFASLALGLAAVLKKDSVENGWVVLGERSRNATVGNFWFVKRDYSIMPDPGRTWKTE
ncbi:hypothetical protein AAG570_000131 [Ranatra chinensis]|uniref:NADH dehydrogenase [ubiquinone] 1 alpha subcomplex subunit 11 n=1 Tax=Ranatra chinensis TaxID=642074 RepID=A0ABD0YW71_9HEMI